MFLHKKYEGHNKYFIYLSSKFQAKKFQGDPFKVSSYSFLKRVNFRRSITIIRI